MTDRPTGPATAAEWPSVPVRMSPKLMEDWASRDIDGNRMVWSWGEPDADGFYTPTVTRNTDDNIADAMKARILAALPEALRSLYTAHNYLGKRAEEDAAALAAAIERVIGEER